jgi:hypothetical protein
VPLCPSQYIARLACVLPLLTALAGPVAAAELDVRAAAAYERYMTGIEQAFAGLTGSDTFLQQASPQTLTRLRGGEIVAGPGQGDGIMDVPNGLIHHWRAAVFVPNVRLADVLEMVRDYSDYYSVYDWMIASALISREGDRYRSFFRLKRSVGVVTGVLDLWTVTEYRYLRADRAVAVSNAECLRQVDHPGERRERRLPSGTGNGYLWRANALSKYLERDGGVYMELDTIGLSRDFPPLLGWIIEPIARRLGRDSAADSLNQLRRALRSPSRIKAEAIPVVSGRTWCGE